MFLTTYPGGIVDEFLSSVSHLWVFELVLSIVCLRTRRPRDAPRRPEDRACRGAQDHWRHRDHLQIRCTIFKSDMHDLPIWNDSFNGLAVAVVVGDGGRD